MSRAMITESNLTAIANAIRAKLGVETTYTPAQMATAIGTIHGEPVNQEKTVNQNGEVTPDSGYDGLSKVTVAVPQPTLVSKSIAANGSYDPASDNADGYSGVTVNVPNSYAAGDEGKVVSNGQLVEQTAHADVTPTTSDQTIDTTNNNSIKVKGDANLQAGNIKNGVQIFGVTGSYEGGGGGATLITKTITENGTYNASSDNADGYSQVTVNVSGGSASGGKLKVGTTNPIIKAVEEYGPMNSYSTDYIIPILDDGTPAKLDLSQPFEICCRFKVGSNPGNNTSRNIWGASNSYYYCPMMEVRGNMIGYSLSANGSSWVYNAKAITPSGYSLPLDTWITAKMTWDGTNLTVYANDGTNTYTETAENVTPYYNSGYGFEFGGCNKSTYSIAGYGAIFDLAHTYLKQGSTMLWGAQSGGGGVSNI